MKNYYYCFCRSLLLMLVALFSGGVYAQDFTVSGTVKDFNTDEPLPGVNVIIKNTAIGTITDANGKYQLSVPDGDVTIVFSSVGFTSEEVNVQNRSLVDISLMQDIKALSEVVVIGYGTQLKSDLTGSVSSVSAEDIADLPVSRVDQALQGRAAGVQVTQTSGAPGAGTSIRVRGGNSITGSNEPLWVIDGIIVGTNFDLNNLNANDVKSIEILKDASSIAIYGSRGANGVVLVTTKSGENIRGGKPQVNVGIYTSTQLGHVTK